MSRGEIVTIVFMWSAALAIGASMFWTAPPCVEHVAIIRSGEHFDCPGGHVTTTPFQGWETSITARCVCGGGR